jgi:hypothetical protein
MCCHEEGPGLIGGLPVRLDVSQEHIVNSRVRYKKMYMAGAGGTVPFRFEKVAENRGREEDNDVWYGQAVDGAR